MIFLQAAIGFGLFWMTVVGFCLLIGIPLVAKWIGLRRIRQAAKELSKNERNQIWRNSFFIALAIMVLLFLLLWLLLTPFMDLTYS